uniref:CX domain-containing protein n=1 Tax=Ditylenchus dipsaci TaxID=166011 RepID=A0A915D590_9BILA
MAVHIASVAILSTDTLNVLIEAKRGGGGGGFGRGGSAGRSGGGIFGGSRGGSAGRSSGGGLFGGSKSSGARTGTSGGMSGGGYNRNQGGHSAKEGWLWKILNSRYSKGSGIGSASRSSTFKNMVVGAAAGYLTYQAGKAIIRNTMSPMMWGGRSYYWGQNHYQGPPGGNMCRMPMEGDSQFSNVYFQDGGRPKEIVWSCRYNEYCCGYECCPSNTGGGGYGGYGYRGGIGLGSIIVLLLLCGCCAFVVHQVCKSRRSSHATSFFSSNSKYSPGEATYTASEAPPQYTASGAGYPPQPPPPGFVYS